MGFISLFLLTDVCWFFAIMIGRKRERIFFFKVGSAITGPWKLYTDGDVSWGLFAYCFF